MLGDQGLIAAQPFHFVAVRQSENGIAGGGFLPGLSHSGGIVSRKRTGGESRNLYLGHHGFRKTIGMHNVGVQLVVSRLHRRQSESERTVLVLLRMKVIHGIETRLPNRIQVHDVAVVRHQVVHFAGEDAEGGQLNRVRLHPARLAHPQR